LIFRKARFRKAETNRAKGVAQAKKIGKRKTVVVHTNGKEGLRRGNKKKYNLLSHAIFKYMTLRQKITPSVLKI